MSQEEDLTNETHRVISSHEGTFMKRCSTHLAMILILSSASAFADVNGVKEGPGFSGITDGFEMVNGVQVSQNDPLASHVVAINMDLSVKIFGKMIPILSQVCTGTIISPHLILSAAHCVLSPGLVHTGTATLYFGVDMAHPVATATVDKFLADPEYAAGANQNSHDLSLIHFSGNLPAGFSPIGILSDKVELQAGEPVVGEGYGITGPKNQDSGILREGSYTINEPHFSNDEVSVTEKTASLCHGDSGGPTFAKVNGQYFVWGVTSRLDVRVDPNASCVNGAILTDVRTEAAFVESATKQLGE